ncbi:MAG: hypothetical protein QXJ97_11515 [Desulfurococcaceae archaeon]
MIENDPGRRYVLEKTGRRLRNRRDAADTSMYSNINLREITIVIASTSKD